MIINTLLKISICKTIILIMVFFVLNLEALKENFLSEKENSIFITLHLGIVNFDDLIKKKAFYYFK
ncbi:hypothetical protein DM790_17610 [Flavobacterium collinsii]|jgi:hypothetical protein|nr:hypothetical protein [Flavobacterium collinsii]